MATQETHIEYDVIEHDGGSHLVEAETNTDGTATIRFGTSFTLRLDEHNVDKLRQLLFDVGQGLLVERSVRKDADSASDEELEAVDDILKSWSREKEDYGHLLDLPQLSED